MRNDDKNGIAAMDLKSLWQVRMIFRRHVKVATWSWPRPGIDLTSLETNLMSILWTMYHYIVTYTQRYCDNLAGIISAGLALARPDHGQNILFTMFVFLWNLLQYHRISSLSNNGKLLQSHMIKFSSSVSSGWVKHGITGRFTGRVVCLSVKEMWFTCTNCTTIGD